MAKDKVEPSDILLPLERLTRLMRAGEHARGLNPAQWEALRYLSRANRFSNSPGALTKYLGSTKGTVSQTIKALERKGLIAKSQRENERRSVMLVLTETGLDALNNDPQATFLKSIDELAGKTKRRLAKGLEELTEMELARQEQPSFGPCMTCRYFREDRGSPHQCMLFEEPISHAETLLICAEHLAG
jgi:DNA-binding MarR family transcriptional regulator